MEIVFNKNFDNLNIYALKTYEVMLFFLILITNIFTLATNLFHIKRKPISITLFVNLKTSISLHYLWSVKSIRSATVTLNKTIYFSFRNIWSAGFQISTRTYSGNIYFLKVRITYTYPNPKLDKKMVDITTICKDLIMHP